MNELIRLQSEIDRLEAELEMHDTRSYAMNANGDRLYRLEVHPRRPWVVSGDLTGNQAIARFRDRADAEWFCSVANRELERIFREGYNTSEPAE